MTKKKASPQKFKTVQEYIASVPAPAGQMLTGLRQAIIELVPDGEDIISYNIPCIKLNGKDLLWYAAWKEHISLYPRTKLMEKTIKELAQYAESKGTIKFPLNQPFPFNLLNKIVKTRVQKINTKTQV